MILRRMILFLFPPFQIRSKFRLHENSSKFPSKSNPPLPVSLLLVRCSRVTFPTWPTLEFQVRSCPWARGRKKNSGRANRRTGLHPRNSLKVSLLPETRRTPLFQVRRTYPKPYSLPFQEYRKRRKTSPDKLIIIILNNPLNNIPIINFDYHYPYSILEKKHTHIYPKIEERKKFIPRKFQARERRRRRRRKRRQPGRRCWDLECGGRLDAGQGVSVHAAVIARGECN